MSLSLKIEKTIQRPVADVFNALKSGLLFMNCSGDSASMKIDFRVGGKYHFEFKSMGKDQFGEFLEIVPDRKIVFTWCQAFEPNRKPDTTVTIDLSAAGEAATKLSLQHAGFKDQTTCDAHVGGWTSGLDDMSTELERGRLRMVRHFSAPVEQVFETLQTPSRFFGHMGDLATGRIDFKVGGRFELPNKNGGVRGEFLEIIPSEKIRLSWKGGCGDIAPDSEVTLILRTKPKGSSLELLHTGLSDNKTQMNHRQAWEYITEKMSETLGRRPN